MKYGGASTTGLGNIPAGFKTPRVPPIFGRRRRRHLPRAPRSYPNVFRYGTNVPSPALGLYQNPETLFSMAPGSTALAPVTREYLVRCLLFLREFYRIMKIREAFNPYYLPRVTSNTSALFLAPALANSAKYINTYINDLAPSAQTLMQDFLSLFAHGTRLGTASLIVPPFFRNQFHTTFNTIGPGIPPNEADITQLYLILKQRPNIEPSATSIAPPTPTSFPPTPTVYTLGERDNVNTLFTYNNPQHRYAAAPPPPDTVVYL